MPWIEAARREHDRRRPRYASDVSDGEWALIAPLLPPDRPRGRPRKTDLREVVNAILYMASTGCQWRMLPRDLPPPSTVQRYFYDWRDRGLWQGISNTLVMAARDLEGREASPTASVIDSQSVKTTESGGASGLDAGKRIKGRKRHAMTDTLGLLVGLVVHHAGVQDATERPGCCGPSAPAGPGCAMSTPMAATPARSCAPPCAGPASGRSRSSSAPMPPKASR